MRSCVCVQTDTRTNLLLFKNLRMKVPAEKGSWWLIGLKIKNKTKQKKRSLAAVAKQGPLKPAVLQGEACTKLPACTVPAG